MQGIRLYSVLLKGFKDAAIESQNLEKNFVRACPRTSLWSLRILLPNTPAILPTTLKHVDWADHSIPIYSLQRGRTSEIHCQFLNKSFAFCFRLFLLLTSREGGLMLNFDGHIISKSCILYFSVMIFTKIFFSLF